MIHFERLTIFPPILIAWLMLVLSQIDRIRL